MPRRPRRGRRRRRRRGSPLDAHRHAAGDAHELTLRSVRRRWRRRRWHLLVVAGCRVLAPGQVLVDEQEHGCLMDRVVLDELGELQLLLLLSRRERPDGRRVAACDCFPLAAGRRRRRLRRRLAARPTATRGGRARRLSLCPLVVPADARAGARVSGAGAPGVMSSSRRPAGSRVPTTPLTDGGW